MHLKPPVRSWTVTPRIVRRVEAAAAADQPPQEAPVLDAAAGDVARAEHEVRVARRRRAAARGSAGRARSRRPSRSPARRRRSSACANPARYACPSPVLAGAMEDLDLRVGSASRSAIAPVPSGELSSTIRMRWRPGASALELRRGGAHDPLDVRRLVVGGDHDPDRARASVRERSGRSGRSDAPSGCGRRSVRPRAWEEACDGMRSGGPGMHGRRGRPWNAVPDSALRRGKTHGPAPPMALTSRAPAQHGAASSPPPGGGRCSRCAVSRSAAIAASRGWAAAGPAGHRRRRGFVGGHARARRLALASPAAHEARRRTRRSTAPWPTRRTFGSPARSTARSR